MTHESMHNNLRICSPTEPRQQPLPEQQKRVESGEQDACYIPLAGDARENSRGQEETLVPMAGICMHPAVVSTCLKESYVGRRAPIGVAVYGRDRAGEGRVL